MFARQALYLLCYTIISLEPQEAVSLVVKFMCAGIEEFLPHQAGEISSTPCPVGEGVSEPGFQAAPAGSMGLDHISLEPRRPLGGSLDNSWN